MKAKGDPLVNKTNTKRDILVSFTEKNLFIPRFEPPKPCFAVTQPGWKRSEGVEILAEKDLKPKTFEVECIPRLTVWDPGIDFVHTFRLMDLKINNFRFCDVQKSQFEDNHSQNV